MEKELNGSLYVVSTPIGNLKDISQRAIEVLNQVDWIAVEDSRHSKKLLQHLGINKTLISFHEHNEQYKSEDLLLKLQDGQQGALISDAGTPLINDPGYSFIRLLRQNNITVTPIPGATALITALSVAGLPTDKFIFEGFLPAKSNKRNLCLEGLEAEQRTIIFYETPHRLLESLKAIQEIMGIKTEVMVARELTKKFESFVFGTSNYAYEYFKSHPKKIRGEFVLVIHKKHIKKSNLSELDNLMQILLKQSLPIKQISEIISEHFKVKKNLIYKKALSLKKRLEL